MNVASDLRRKRLPLNNGQGEMSALGAGVASPVQN